MRKRENVLGAVHFWTKVLLTCMGFAALLGCKELQKPPQQIIFPSKTFFDGEQIGGYVYVAGTLTGEGLAYPNNTTVIACYAKRRECLTYSVEQIGPNQIGHVDAPLDYPVIKWDAYEIVASGTGDAGPCSKVTISIVRKAETALWVTEPINQSRSQCKNANTKILKWTIEDSPGWAAIFRK